MPTGIEQHWNPPAVARLLFSTDHPFRRPARAAVDAFPVEFATGEDRDAFGCGNARRLFRIPVAGAGP